ncbi:S8 family serine peptidase [Niabella sp.]|uniref:S8 family serine peptidase n=1 Tax=Niabella sp. TaxID=1962976 RepID=UPI00260229B3|nr:S8 family serine peptidase [Niabella sp.]
MLTVGIIDSGLASSEVAKATSKITGAYLFRNPEGKIIVINNEFEDQLGHGSTCYKLIKQYCNNANFFIAKIFKSVPATDEEILVRAINLCLEQNVDIINISLGMQQNYISPQLNEVLNTLYKLNKPVIAAAYYEDKHCFPACHPRVIGVGCIKSLSNGEVAYAPASAIEFYTTGVLSPEYGNTSGSSFSCARMTGYVTKLLDGNKRYTISEIKRHFRARATLVGQSSEVTSKND